MTLTMTWRMRNDAWLDNGLELFGHIAEHIAGQHSQVLQVQWQPDELQLIIYDVRRFVELLDDEIDQRIQTTVFYTAESKGKRSKVMKPFVGFNQQPPKQHPPIFQSDRRRKFLEDLLTPKRRDSSEAKGCPLCGETIEGKEQQLTLSIYPFVTKIKSLSGIRTQWHGDGLKGFTEYMTICSRCYFLGAVVWMDDALLYLCDIGGTDGMAVILLPAPMAGNLMKLRQLKFYRPKHGERRTNVKFKQRPKGERQSEEEQGVREGRYSLLLAFMERTLSEIAEKEEVTDLFAEARRRISDGWLFISIPQGRLKNITAHDLVLDEPTLRLVVKLVEQGNLPYAHMIAEIWLSDEKGKTLSDETSTLRETFSQAILTDNFELFAQAFVPKPRRQLRFPFAVGDEFETLVKLWRWSDMTAETLEVVKKAGRALAAIAASRKQPVLLYALERVRSGSDLLEVLKEGVHRLIGLEAEEMQYISLDALEQLTELIHQTTDARQFADLKNTLIVFAGIAYAKSVMAQARATTSQ
ncbi:MAG: hypothetical protein N3B10_13045 [Armatimonadetes bacterium]|nr:hypothetical protein [Armatimonadota bacterium]MCX7969394.1 hypothetical protein [Armatimonadota bacterium]MDW8144023.1 hypothetical protein [Armatimonadota bacterium]